MPGPAVITAGSGYFYQNIFRSDSGFLKYSSKNLPSIFSVAVVLLIPDSSQNF